MIEYFCEHCGSSFRIDYRGEIPAAVAALCPECLNKELITLRKRMGEIGNDYLDTEAD